MYKVLKGCPLFREMDSEEIKHVLEEVSFKVKAYEKNEIISLSGDIVKGQSILLKGSVKGEMVDFAGKIIKIEDIEHPRLIAPAFLFGQNNRYPVNIIANEDVRVLFIPKDSFVRIMQLNEKILKNYLDSISDRAQFLSRKLKFLSFQTIRGKVANYLFEISGKFQRMEFILPKSQSELAEMFGVTRPSIGRTIRELHQEGIINAAGKKVVICDKDRLLVLMK